MMTTKYANLPVLVTTLLIAAVFAASGCGEPDSNCPESGVVEHDSIRVGLVSPASLCELIEWGDDSIGVYRIDSLETDVEDDPFHTYVELSLVEAWKPGSATAPVIRGSGGPGRECKQSVSSSIHHHLTVGEEVVVFLREPSADSNKGHYWFHSQGVFQTDDGEHFGNGNLFAPGGIALDDFEALVKANGFDPEADDFCSQDVGP